MVFAPFRLWFSVKTPMPRRPIATAVVEDVKPSGALELAPRTAIRSRRCGHLPDRFGTDSTTLEQYGQRDIGELSCSEGPRVVHARCIPGGRFFDIADGPMQNCKGPVRNG